MPRAAAHHHGGGVVVVLSRHGAPPTQEAFGTGFEVGEGKRGLCEKEDYLVADDSGMEARRGNYPPSSLAHLDGRF